MLPVISKTSRIKAGVSLLFSHQSTNPIKWPTPTMCYFISQHFLTSLPCLRLSAPSPLLLTEDVKILSQKICLLLIIKSLFSGFGCRKHHIAWCYSKQLQVIWSVSQRASGKWGSSIFNMESADVEYSAMSWTAWMPKTRIKEQKFQKHILFMSRLRRLS